MLSEVTLSRLHSGQNRSTWSRKTMAGTQQQQILPGQGGGIDLGRRLQRMTERHQHHERFLVHRLRHYPRFVERQRQNQHVQIAGLEPLAQLRRVALLDLQRHIGRAAVQPWDQMR
jgi:hypothetical protein